MPFLIILLAMVLAYLVGSISSAILTSKIMRLPDPRTAGSNNPGATNILRLGGKKAALITLAGDILKGILPVLIAKLFNFSEISLALIGIAVFLGHLYPIFFGFKGGKGVATAVGVILILCWPVGVLLILTWLLITLLFRYSSLSALVAAIVAPFYMGFLSNPSYTAATLIMSLFLILRHRKNIKNLWTGNETKIGR